MSTGTEMIRRRYALMAPRVLNALRHRGYEAHFAADADAARALALSLILPDETVSWGGSLTLEETGILSALRAGGYRLSDRDAAASPEERRELMRQALLCSPHSMPIGRIRIGSKRLGGASLRAWRSPLGR